MSTSKQIIYLRNTLTLADDLSQFDINSQLAQALLEYSNYKIVELNHLTEQQQLVFTGYELISISVKEARSRAWWAYDNCIVIFTELNDGSTKLEVISSLNALMKVQSEHVVGSQLYEIITNHEHLSIHEPDGTLYPAVYTKNPQSFKFADDDITSYIELRNQVLMNGIDTGTQMIGLKVLQHDGEPHLMFCGEQIATDISFRSQIDLYRTIGGKFVCHTQTTRFYGQLEHQVYVFQEHHSPEILNRKLQKELESYLECLSVDESFNFRQRRV